MLEILTIKRTFIGDIIDEENTHCSSVIGGCDSSESFLSCSIPYLQLHTLAIKFNGADFEVDSNSSNERWSERVLAETEQAA
jgi:hypothetical protein